MKRFFNITAFACSIIAAAMLIGCGSNVKESDITSSADEATSIPFEVPAPSPEAIAASQNASMADKAGKYILSYETHDTEGNTYELQEYFILNADGTGSINNICGTADSEAIKWNESYIYTDYSSVEYVIEDNTLKIKDFSGNDGAQSVEVWVGYMKEI